MQILLLFFLPLTSIFSDFKLFSSLKVLEGNLFSKQLKSLPSADALGFYNRFLGKLKFRLQLEEPQYDNRQKLPSQAFFLLHTSTWSGFSLFYYYFWLEVRYRLCRLPFFPLCFLGYLVAYCQLLMVSYNWLIQLDYSIQATYQRNKDIFKEHCS